MAESPLASLIDSILENLGSLLFESTVGWGLDKEVEKLSETLRAIQAVLADAGDREANEKAVHVWLKELKDVVYDIDDFVDEFATRSAILSDQKVRCFSSLCLLLENARLHLQIASKMKDNTAKTGKIFERGSIFGLSARSRNRVMSPETIRPLTGSFVNEPEIYGREEDKINIVRRLLGSDDQTIGGLDLCDPDVIPIVGMGGLGKTTLAQLAYNDAKVSKYFGLRMWVMVSDPFNEVRLIKAIVEQIRGVRFDDLRINSLKQILQAEINGRRYLLVLDDVWSCDQRSWQSLYSVLTWGAKGSKIIVTTRRYEIARMMGTNPYHLREIFDDVCWTLFKKAAFGNEKEAAYSHLELIGREIVRKCDGVPLVAKVLGSLMFSKRQVHDWLNVINSEIWTLPTDFEAGILPGLWLSYNHLPSHLKQCFAFCSIFPKDYRMKKEKLIQLWAAEGFIRSTDGSKSLYDIGNEYFNELLQRSFFQDVQVDEYGNVEFCKVHDLIHDLAQSVAGDECLTLSSTSHREILGQTRHLSFSSRFPQPTSSMTNFGGNKVRTFIALERGFSLSNVDLISSFKYLRALTLACSIDELPSFISSLIHLRYLDIHDTFVEKLPEDIIQFRNLQTLKLGMHLKELPQGMSHLKQLLHLDINPYSALTKMPPNIGELKFLRTLTKFIVDSRCGIEELHELDLCGSIVIENLENVKDVHQAEKADLKGKHYLHELDLLWSEDSSYDVDRSKIEITEKILEGLQPPSKLQRLSIENYGGFQLPRWFVPSLLPNIAHVKLDGCTRCQLLHPLADLPMCESLELHKMYSVKSIDLKCNNGAGREGFPLLKRLILVDMPCLEGFINVNEINNMPCLEILMISGCPKLTSLPNLPSVSHLTLSNCNGAILSSLAGLTSLSKLRIAVFPEVESLPREMLQCHYTLKDLEINGFNSLKSLPIELRNLSYLRSLRISVCRDLTSLFSEMMEGLTSLQELSIRDCENLTCLPSKIQYLTSLKELTIVGLPKLTSLPEGVQHLTSLEELTIGKCKGLICLPEWLGNLSRLRVLKVKDFELLMYLPMSLIEISTLEELSIRNCPHLRKRYNMSSGEDWGKISHISNVDIP